MLQPTERAKIRLYLGYPDEFRYKDTRLESMLDAISEEAIAQVRAVLTLLQTVDTYVLDSISAAGLKQVDEIHFFAAGSQIGQQRKAGRQYVGQLSIILGVPINADYFGITGYPGDSFSGFGSARGAYRLG